MNQVELHPYLTQESLVKLCSEHEIILTSYSSLGRGVSDKTGILYDKTVLDIANKYNKTASQILLAWNTHRNTVVIPKSHNPQHIDDNLKSSDIELSDDDVNKLNQLNKRLSLHLSRNFYVPIKRIY